MAKRRYTSAEKKQIRKEQRQKDALRCYRFRPLKNFLIWLTGVISCLVILVSAIFVGLKFVPISTFLGENNEEVLSPDITSKSIIDAFLKYDTYDMSDFPVITNSLKDLAESEELKNYIYIDTEKLSSLKFDEKFGEELSSCVKITATLQSLGGAQVLGDLGNLDIFKTWDEVSLEQMPVDTNEDGVIDKEGEEFVNNPKLYYYKTLSNQYLRAFGDDGVRVSDSIGHELYYPNLAEIPLLEVMNVMTDSFGRLGLNNLLATFGAGEDFLDSFLGDILNGKTISDLGNISAEDIKLNGLLDAETLSLLSSSIVDSQGNPVVVAPEDLTVGHLSGDLGSFNINNLKLNGFLNAETLNLISSSIVDSQGNPVVVATGGLTVGHLSGEYGIFDVENLKLKGLIDDETLKILSSSIVDSQGNPINVAPENLTVGHLSGDETSFDVDSIRLDGFLGKYQENKETYNLLHSIIVWESGQDIPDAEDLTIGDLSNGIYFGNIRLVDVLSTENQTLEEQYQSNKKLYDVLCSAAYLGAGEDNYLRLTVAQLQKGLDFNNIALSSIDIDNATLEILVKAVNATRQGANQTMLSTDELTVAHISADMLKHINLTDVLPYKNEETDNSKLYAILLEATGKTIDPSNVEEQAQTLNITSLTGFNVDWVNLSTLLPINNNPELYKILKEATKTSEENIKIGDFKKFKLSNISLETFMSSSDNKIINALIEQGCTVGNIGTQINALKLYDIYGANCFTAHDGSANTPKYSLDEKTETYTLDDNGTYMISKNAGIWLFLCYDGGEVETGANALGCRKTYTKSTATMGDLQDVTSGAKISTRITSATIRQLVDAGILTSANQNFYAFTLSYLANLSISG